MLCRLPMRLVAQTQTPCRKTIFMKYYIGCSLEDDYSTEYLIGQIKGINVALHLKQVGQNLYLGVVQDTLYWAGHTTDQCAALIEQLCD